jgi:hypothetical protein
MKNILEIDTTQYSHYAFLENGVGMQAFIQYPEGDLLYEHCDFYDCGNFTIGAFSREVGDVNNVYKIISDEGIQYIQADSYEVSAGFINNDYDVDNTIFMFANSASMPDYIRDGKPPTLHEDRCDSNKFGPVAFENNNNVMDEDIFDSSVHNISNIVEVKHSFLSSVGNFHVVKMQCKNYPESAYKNVSSVVGVARTFIGLIKLIIEWAETAKDPWNVTDRIAEAALNGLADLAIPQEIIEEINEYQVDMPVSLFLQNSPNCRGLLGEKSELPPLFKKWYLTKISYESLNSLAIRNPEVSIPDSILENEKKNIYTPIYEFFLSQGINIESHTLNDLLSMISSGQFKSDTDGFRKTQTEIKKALHLQ